MYTVKQQKLWLYILIYILHRPHPINTGDSYRTLLFLMLIVLQEEENAEASSDAIFSSDNDNDDG